MKKLIISLACLSSFGVAAGAMAAPPHGKATILHCGCVVDSTGTVGMAYIEINVSKKAKGHSKHVAGTLDSCFNGVDQFVDFVRTGSDCQVGGSDFLAACTDGQEANVSCGEAVTE